MKQNYSGCFRKASTVCVLIKHLYIYIYIYIYYIYIYINVNIYI